MKKIYFYLILIYSINFYGNDTITAVSIKNINLRENATTDSKVITEIKPDDTLIITETENGWSKAVYKDSLNGFVKSEYVKEIASKKETLKLLLLNKLFKSYFLSALLVISALCFGFLYLLKSKLVQLDIIGNFSLVIKSFLIGFIFTIIGTLYYFYDLFSFFKIVGVGILILILTSRLSSIFKKENKIKEYKKQFKINNPELELNEINNIYIEEQISLCRNSIESEKEVMEIQLSIKKNNLGEVKKLVNDRLNELKSNKENLSYELRKEIFELYGEENGNNLFNGEPFKGLHKLFIPIYIGEPEKILEFIDSNNNKRENYLYKKLNNYGSNGTWKLNIGIYNDIVNTIEKK